MKDAHVSVIVPMRNEESQAQACLDSLERLVYDKAEFIIVDDRSSDNTFSVVERWVHAHADPCFVTLQAPDEPPPGWVGKAFATDYAIEQSHGELVLIADADVRHAPESLAESVRLLGDNDMLVRLPWVPLRHAGGAIADFLLFVIWAATRVSAALGGLPLSFGAYVLMRRSFYEKVGGFDAQRSFPESLPLARLAAARGKYRLCRPSPNVQAELYDDARAAARGTLRNINFGLVAPLALVAAFVVIGWPLWALSWLPRPFAAAALAAWCAGLSLYEYSNGRSARTALLLGAAGPLSAISLAVISCAALARRVLGLSVSWRGRSIRLQ